MITGVTVRGAAVDLPSYRTTAQDGTQRRDLIIFSCSFLEVQNGHLSLFFKGVVYPKMKCTGNLLTLKAIQDDFFLQQNSKHNGYHHFKLKKRIYKQDKRITHGSWRYIEVFWSETIGLCKKLNIICNIITCNPEPQANRVLILFLKWTLSDSSFQ